jgi:hypothetical protein
MLHVILLGSAGGEGVVDGDHNVVVSSLTSDELRPITSSRVIPT